MTIKQFYLENYPTDDMGNDIKDDATFVGFVTELFGDGDVYKYIGVSDSLVRERLFEELAKQLNKPYDFVYNLWLN
jgi:hypothetical protein|tara:strand:- start:423 stop:650 length:228 start_codon:yes stop_codon:yes gene_type:complete